VARVDDRIVGSILVREVDPQTGYFGLLAVDPADQGSGAGRALVRFAEDVCRARGARAMELRLLVPRVGVDEGKQWLASWYERLGYRAIAREDFAESHPDSVPAMRTPLDILTFRKEL
jgi:ribosomal protein S18 acetylase RimI-like enzyme